MNTTTREFKTLCEKVDLKEFDVENLNKILDRNIIIQVYKEAKNLNILNFEGINDRIRGTATGTIVYLKIFNLIFMNLISERRS